MKTTAKKKKAPAPRKMSAKVAKQLNDRRKKRYAEDPDYRAEQQRLAREAYRSTYRVKPRANNPLENLGDLDVLGTKRRIKELGGKLTQSYDMTETAEAFNITLSGLSKWVSKGVIPGPIYTPVHDVEKTPQPRRMIGTGKRVYVRAEIAAMIKVIGKHYETMTFLRPVAHADTVDAIHAAVKKART